MDIGALGVYVCLFAALYFEVFLLISFFENRPAKKTSSLPKHFPTVSIIVPFFNEEKTIARTVQSLLALDYPKDKLEIMMIDDGSTDSAGAIAQKLASEHSQITYLYKQNGGKYTALNLGIQASTAELVGCLDADSFTSTDALIEVVKRFEEDPTVMAIMPAMKVYRPRTMLERMQAVEYAFGVFYKKMFDNLSALNVLPGPFSLYKREVFTKIGLFHHAHNTEDMEIAFRMHKHGLKIVNAHNATVYTTVPTTVRALLKQRTRWSQGFLENLRDYKYMLLNPRYGNFGLLVLPFGLFAFFSGLYSAFYMSYIIVSTVITRTSDMYATQIPLHITAPHFDLFYVDTSMMMFTTLIVLGFTVVAIVLGNRIAEDKLNPFSFISYFALFGFIAPLWLAQAAWGAVRSQPAPWR
ncbi:MAG TPA: glycosyltransferase family 2 protein [Candidatus Paceibacterota bacterium]|nr:glycosyltransferase family 2 protein [Candidatus Paceibacterota bacterium]